MISIHLGGGHGIIVWMTQDGVHPRGYKLVPKRHAMLFSDRYVHRHWHLPLGWIFVRMRPSDGKHIWRRCKTCMAM